MSYYIVRVDPDPDNEGAFIETPLPNYGPYKTGQMAAGFAKKVGREIGAKVLPKRIRQAPDWHDKAAAFAASALKMPEDWDLEPIENHFVHPHIEDPRLIAFTPSDEFGVIGKVKNMKPGAYLTKFYPNLSDPDVRRYAAMFDEMTPLRFARTAEEIVWVYRNGVGSCMSKGKGSYDSSVHPVSVYGAGDLAIAWMPNDKGKVAERVLCWPAHKRYTRIYGDGTGRLGRELMKLGYKVGTLADLNGARLTRVVESEDGLTGTFVLPYLDSHGGGSSRVRDDGKHLIIDDEGGVMGNGASGLATGPIFQPQMFDEAYHNALQAAALAA